MYGFDQGQLEASSSIVCVLIIEIFSIENSHFPGAFPCTREHDLPYSQGIHLAPAMSCMSNPPYSKAFPFLGRQNNVLDRLRPHTSYTYTVILKSLSLRSPISSFLYPTRMQKEIEKLRTLGRIDLFHPELVEHPPELASLL